MSQWLRKKIISFMGRVYLWLDKGVVHETSPILDIPIDQDFQDMSRQELCQHIENKFDWKKNSFWNLESTQKIRLCCQMARNIIKGEEE
jgi:environmental stress-induced protein Ves